MSSPEKSSLRKASLARRQSIAPADHAAWSRACVQKLLALAESLPPARRVIAGYSPMRSEVNVTPALVSLAVSGHIIVLPRVVEGQRELLFYPWVDGDPGSEPHGPRTQPDMLIVPLVAFDRRGNRLGFGAGYYDVTLAALRAAKPVIAIGAAFALQEIEAIPAEAYDQPLDFVVTEKEVITVY